MVLTEHLSDKAAALARLHDRTLRHPPTEDAGPTVVQTRRRRRPKSHFTAAEVTVIVEQYQAGRSMNDLARQHGVHRSSILHALRRTETPLRYRGLPPDRVAEAAALYRVGWSLARLGEKYGCTDMSVAHALRQRGEEIRPRRGRSY